ncbi:serine protease gd-like [Arctopsyche grandis]|uniref:serine protease gd-like n=1 Tax=Arctopsyche grandis TaxID=121162 RepID=UPI00406D63BB
MKSEYLGLCFLLFNTFIIGISGQFAPQSPCPRIFQYEYYDRWYGFIGIPAPNYGTNIRIQLKMTVGTNLPSQYVGRIDLIDTKEELDQKLYYGGTIRYRVHFPLRFPVPSVDKIKYNGRTICAGSPNQNLFYTKIHLNHELAPNNNNDFNIQVIEIDPNNPNPVNFQPKPAEFPTTTSSPLISLLNFTGIQLVPLDNNVFGPQTPQVTTPAPPPPSLDSLLEVFECGVSAKTFNPLIAGGTSFSQGEWPWIVALFHKNTKGVTFVCSGTLLSTSHVITAAHCVLDLNKSSKKSFSLVARLGSHNLQDWADPNDKILNIIKVEVHPNFNRSNLHNDIAVLSVATIQFTDYIKPICIWDGLDSQELIVGKNGKVVGWGRDETGQLVTAEPKLVTMPIVSTETCKASNVEFIRYTSDTTLCAGNRDGVGPCNGDSGGGMYLPLNKRWYIRGIVSNSIRDPDDYGSDSCSLSNYVIFTDAAKYTPWIKEVMGN